MDVFALRARLVDDYQRYTRSFIKIKDPRIEAFVDDHLSRGTFWPEPLLQLNPTFESGGLIEDLVAEGHLHAECSRIFRLNKSDTDHTGRQLRLHKHQRDAILKAKEGESYVLTSGTGSGKSLTYIVPIVDHVLRKGSGRGIQAIVVYPMNALANSQDEELRKFLEKGYPQGQPPVSFARYTGQESAEARELIRAKPPDILLTNYMMLELMLTRAEDRDLVRAAQGLSYLVFDELHTYRGRQGADVALLIRRCRQAFAGHNTVCVGTSATMASGGTVEAQREEVAGVAQALFGVTFKPSQVVGESLQRATPEVNLSRPEIRAQLLSLIESEGEAPTDRDEFIRHPLTSWIESTFGLGRDATAGGLTRQRPRRIEGGEIESRESASMELAKLLGANAGKCATVLRRFLLGGASIPRDSDSPYPVFAFRLHQFFTRGDTVWATLEPGDARHLEISKKASRPGHPDKPLFPMVFCRHCGAAYFRATVASSNGTDVLYPREDWREPNDDGSADAYLYISEQSPWPTEQGTDLLDRLPEFMLEPAPNGEQRVRSDSRNDLPQTVHVAPSGQLVAEGAGARAALIRRNFLFCLDPACGVAYTKSQRAERGKLATLGVDNRSTATTVLAVRALIELQGSDLGQEARKLLSFTDNRQDASLQAGHFNDFVQVALLRSALHRAINSRGDQGLGHGDLSREVFAAMQLPFEEYAADPEVQGPAREKTHESLRRVIAYYLYRDLQRGWRVTAPNLEDCGLLKFDYVGLAGVDGLLHEEALWATGLTTKDSQGADRFVAIPTVLQAASIEKREEVLRTLLDVLRRSLAVKVDVLDQRAQQDLVEQTQPRLLEDTVWYLENARELTKAAVAYPRAKSGGERFGLYVSSYGAYGRYLKRALRVFLPAGHNLSRAEIDEVIRFLFYALKRYGIIEQVRSGREQEDPGYQINADALRWLPSSGEVRPIDRTRLLQAGEVPPEVNKYFVDCYRQFVELKCVLEAREHTAQVVPEDREVREQRFRSGNLPLLFCSPTMELGVDIAQLNLVNLRNVPPTPANYAQRSGRAGRGGQPALVFTYCAGRSPHDQYFYREPSKMVAGAVSPPRIDLRNRDLIRSHIHAVWMEVAKSDLGKTLATVLDLTPQSGKLPLPLQAAISNDLRNPAFRAKAFERASMLMSSLAEYLKSASWYHDNWVKEVLDQIERSFEEACYRWRSLYRAAVRQRALHHRIVGDHSRPEEERRHSRRLRAQAESQQDLLTKAEGIYQGDFYSYRYFAAEGFFPGYNFPRLPLSAYVPGRRQRKGRDEYISRPRFLAISEFGPRALIYHEGARYRVYKVNLDFDSDDVEDTHDLSTVTLKRCVACGYAHVEGEAYFAEVCDRCGAALAGPARIDNLVRLQNVSLKLAQRITCDEEERQRFGYKIVTSYRFPEVGGKQDRKDADVTSNDVPLLKLSYGDATDLYRINQGWSNQRPGTPQGFNLDLERGYWSRNQADDQDSDDSAAETRVQRVVPYVIDTKNALVMRFEPKRSEGEMAGLQAAFRQAIQQHFQLESRELASEPMPSASERREILFYEASEGGAGVLRQIVEDPKVLPALARTALEICHYHPDTLDDLGADKCGRACYECLLDYGNQPEHRIIDRAAIRDLLRELSQATCLPSGGAGSRAERMVHLRKSCDSKLETKWLDLLDEFMLRPPSDSQRLLEAYSTRPDFFYQEFNAAIYIDGPHHDAPDQKRNDEAITTRLMEAGYIVIRFHHAKDWLEVLKRHPDVFGEPQQ